MHNIRELYNISRRGNVMKDTNVIRMATLLYSESEGIKKKSTILRKIIEAVFVELNNVEMSQKELQIKIQEVLNVFVNEEEIDDILEKGKSRNYFVRTSVKKEIKYNIDLKRYQRLKENSRRNIEEYIDEFITKYEYGDETKETIYKYIYYLFKRNIEDFSKILGGKMQVDENLEQNFTPDNLKVIKQFIEWDDPEKNTTILALMGCSLEYSMLVGDNSYLYGTRLGTIFSNKILYIDTNIIYYCLGINGEEYRIANEMLLDKCKKAKQQLRITEITEKEFVNTLEHYIDEIKKYESTSLTKLFRRYINNKDVYLFYLEWKKNKKRYNTPEYFKKYIMTKYAEWLKKYKVTIDRETPYEINNQEAQEVIATYSEQIPYKGCINYDAINIYWVECLRQKEGFTNGFSEEKYFILSPHKALKKWDFDRKPKTPIVISPELWMTLLTRFVSRSEDDYRSFVNFINIKVPAEETINNKEFYIIVKAIEEITDEIEQQETVIDVLVEEKFSYLEKEINEELSPLDIYDKTKAKAEKILSGQVSDLEDRVATLTDIVKDMEEDRISREDLFAKNTQEEINKEREKNATVYANDKLRGIRIVSAIIMLVLTGIVVWQWVDFFGLKNENNLFWSLVGKLVAETPIADERVNIFIGWGGFVCTLIVGGLDVYLLRFFFSEETIEKYKSKMKNGFLKKAQKLTA